MNTTPYTIRGIPPHLDRLLRKRAQILGKSLNQLVIEDLAKQNSVPLGNDSLSVIQDLSWFIGSNTIGSDVLATLMQNKKDQKAIARRELNPTS